MKKANVVWGSKEITFSFENEIALTEGEKYSLFLSGWIIPRTQSKAFNDAKVGKDTVITIYGGASDNLALKSYEPSILSKVDTLGQLSLTFSQKVTLGTNCKATLYEGDEEIKASDKFSIDSNDGCLVNVDFGKQPLYNGHQYMVVIPEGSLMDSVGNPYKEISIKYYDGASRKQDCTFLSATPESGSEVKYLKDVAIKVNTPTDYVVGASTKGSMKLYKEGVDDAIGSYSIGIEGVNTVSVAINNYQLEAGSIYKLVLPANVIVPRKSGVNNSTGDLIDISNPEITVTYTTPTDLQPVPHVESLAVSASSDNKVSILVPPFTFDGATNFVRPNADNTAVSNVYDAGQEKTRTYVTLPILEVVNGEDVDKGTVKLEYNPAPTGAEENYTSLEGAPDFSLYAGHTYKVAIPEGVLYPYTYEGEFKNSIFWNLADTLSFQGVKAETVSLSVTTAGITVAAPAAKGEAATLAITPDEGWTVKTLTFNGEDALGSYADGKYTTPKLTEDASVAVELEYTGYAYEEEDVTTGIITAGDTGYSVQVAEGTVTVKGLKAGDTVKAYTLGGALVGSEEAQLNTAKLTLPAGTYIVKVNAVAFKVLVK